MKKERNSQKGEINNKKKGKKIHVNLIHGMCDDVDISLLDQNEVKQKHNKQQKLLIKK